MKLSIATIALATLYMQVSAISAPATSGAPQPATVPNCGYPTVPFFRAWNNATTDHFYTTNKTEMDAFMTQGYMAQGIAAYILPSDTPAPTAVPLFRMYDAKIGDHFYTTNATYRDLLLGQGNYASEGIAGYVYPDQECGTVPLYRLLKYGEAADNFYTTDEEEVKDFIDQLGYDFMEVAAYSQGILSLQQLVSTAANNDAHV
ncbi:hypothetical protein GSI_02067 [Ganoderma sinense ZZ0214-1]|uniref:DUF5648 domain-containing protein n=1 Tax=Ganoderma sinense ZZ0214-1 TaxID=1077348 RepID=A0A2G8SNK7_9APHY|nr:hypothetical protein GSI_02067 [Ganoderma sinense ZZ0214-1]